MSDMRRREFTALVGGVSLLLAVKVRRARAQQSINLPRMGFLCLAGEFGGGEALRVGLRDLGHVEGANVVIEWRWAEKIDQLPELAAELVRRKVNVIFAPSSTFVEAARRVTTTIPIVFAVHADPVGIGHVAALARPGGNITGTSMLLTELSAKGLEMMAEAMPQTRRIGILWNPTTPSHSRALPAVETAGEKLSLELRMVPARGLEDFESAFATMAQERVGGFLAVGSPLVAGQRVPLAALALKHRLPGMFPF